MTNASSAANQIAKEIYELNKKSSPILLAVNAINAREEILNNLRVKVLNLDEDNDEFKLQEISESIKLLRLRSLDTVEEIKK